jgi:signal transduction histidine kinase
MRERIEMLGGTLRLQSAPSRGFEILARIPLAGTETSVR